MTLKVKSGEIRKVESKDLMPYIPPKIVLLFLQMLSFPCRLCTSVDSAGEDQTLLFDPRLESLNTTLLLRKQVSLSGKGRCVASYVGVLSYVEYGSRYSKNTPNCSGAVFLYSNVGCAAQTTTPSTALRAFFRLVLRDPRPPYFRHPLCRHYGEDSSAVRTTRWLKKQQIHCFGSNMHKGTLKIFLSFRDHRYLLAE